MTKVEEIQNFLGKSRVAVGDAVSLAAGGKLFELAKQVDHLKVANASLRYELSRIRKEKADLTNKNCASDSEKRGLRYRIASLEREIYSLKEQSALKEDEENTASGQMTTLTGAIKSFYKKFLESFHIGGSKDKSCIMVFPFSKDGRFVKSPRVLTILADELLVNAEREIDVQGGDVFRQQAATHISIDAEGEIKAEFFE